MFNIILSVYILEALAFSIALMCETDKKPTTTAQGLVFVVLGLLAGITWPLALLIKINRTYF